MVGQDRTPPDTNNHLADAVKARRNHKGLTPAQLATAAQVAPRTIERLEEGRTGHRDTEQLARIMRALGWTPDSAAALRAGQPPTEAGDPTGPRRVGDLPLDVQERLADGSIVASTEVELEYAPGLRVVAILVSDGPPPDLGAWVRARAAIQQAGQQPPPPH